MVLKRYSWCQISASSAGASQVSVTCPLPFDTAKPVGLGGRARSPTPLSVPPAPPGASWPGAPTGSSSPPCSSGSSPSTKTASGAAGVSMWYQRERSLIPYALMALMR